MRWVPCMGLGARRLEQIISGHYGDYAQSEMLPRDVDPSALQRSMKAIAMAIPGKPQPPIFRAPGSVLL